MRYHMNMAGVPVNAMAALMPQPTTSTRASSGGLVRVHGYPGTQAVPSPRPGAIPPTSFDPRTQPSHCSPDVMFPSIYYPTPENMHPPVSLLRDNPMPVPAVQIYNMAGVAQRMRRVGGQSQIGQPAVIQQWPQWRGTGRVG